MKKYYFILVFVLGFVACNNGNASQDNGTTQSINENLDVNQFAEKVVGNSGIHLLDVRTEEEYASGHLENAQNVNINGASFADEVATLDKNKPVYLYCLSGARSAKAASYLSQQGFKEVYNLKGGIIAWKGAEKPVTQESNANKGLNLADYNKLVSADKMVLVDFYAPWCGPCKILSPIVKEVETEMGTFKLQKINYDEAGEVVSHLKIAAIPLLVLYKEGKEVWKHNGTIEKAELKKIIQQYQ